MLRTLKYIAIKLNIHRRLLMHLGMICLIGGLLSGSLLYFKGDDLHIFFKIMFALSIYLFLVISGFLNLVRSFIPPELLIKSNYDNFINFMFFSRDVLYIGDEGYISRWFAIVFHLIFLGGLLLGIPYVLFQIFLSNL